MTNDKGIIIKNIYYMLSYAYQSLQQGNFDEIETESFENVPDILAAILAIGISAQLKHGLSREYIEEQDSLSSLRGKIYIKESLRLKMRNDHRLVCCFDELSENHYMNQILKTTSLYLIHDESVQRKNKDALKKSILFFSKINQLEPSAINWHGFHYNRNNASYLMLMNICYMILHELLLTTEKGKHKLATFLDDREMSRLYERFILEYYKKEFPRFNPASKEIKWNTSGTADYLPKMQSDTMLIDDDNNKKKLIIDAKYYGKILQTWYDAETIRSNHLYQIFSYVKNEDKDNTGLVDGLLLYAKTDDCKIPNSTYNLGGNQISIQTLDLNKDFLDIKHQLNSIVNEWNNKTEIPKNIGPSEAEILSCTDQDNNRDDLWTQYRPFYEDRRKQYEEYMRKLGTMAQHNRETPSDLAEKIKDALLKQEYVVAKTMPDNPHQYCLRKKWIGDITFAETVNTMREYGYVEWFYNRQFMVYNVGEFKYWTMGYPIEVTTLINRTTIEKYTFEDFCNLVRKI